MAESENSLCQNIVMWKSGKEVKRLCLLRKQKVMFCYDKVDGMEDNGKLPCSICKNGAGNNSILCITYQKWVHFSDAMV